MVLLEEEAAVDPTNKEGLYKSLLNTARCATKLGKFETALLLLSDCFKLFDSRAPAHYLSGRILLKLLRLEEAKEELLIANKLQPRNAQIKQALRHLKAALEAQKREDKKLFREFMTYLSQVTEGKDVF